MQKSNLLKEIEDQVRKDIDYINNFSSLAPDARIAPDYTEAKMVKSVASSIYPQLYGYLIQKYDRPEAIHRLTKMGRRAAAIFFAINTKNLNKKRKFERIYAELGSYSREVIKIKDVVKKQKVIQSCTLKKYNCIFCTETAPMENVEIPFCYPSLGYYQNYYNIRSLYLGTIKPRLIHLEMIKTAEDDKDYCEYHLEVLDY